MSFLLVHYFAVLKTKNGIGYRIYHEDGDRLDSEGRRFSGWSSKYDEWLSATDPRITKYHFSLTK